MKIQVAAFSGFCFGVKRAIAKGEELIRNDKGPIATWGPLIHNPQEVERLNRLGIISREKYNDIIEKKLLIRTHGVTPDIFTEVEKRNIQIIDCTCPFVTKVQKIAYEYAKRDYIILIFGNGKHPEVIGILGWALGKGIAFKEIHDLDGYDIYTKKICLVSQTTENIEKFNVIVDNLKSRVNDLVVFNTICSATRQRQNSALDLARDVQLMIVVGGLNSANTQKLAHVCQKTGALTKHIETADALQAFWFNGIDSVGVTAGASTPDWIIEEVVSKMEEIKNTQENEVNTSTAENVGMESHLDEGIAKLEELRPGDLLTGTVVQINSDEVLVDVGGKSEGIIPANELSYRKVTDPNEFVKIGETIKVIVLKKENAEGNMILSKRRVDQEESLDKLEDAFAKQSIIEAKAVEVVKGGILVDVGMRGFVPASLVDLGYVENLEKFIGQNLALKVIEFDKDARKAVLSRKAVLEEELVTKKEQLWSDIAEGQTRKGTVQRLTDFGAFVDLGGVDGLLHVSEMGWGRIEHPRDVVKEGDEIEVYVLGVDKEKERISLGLKQLKPSPWQAAAEKYPVGTVVQGKVVRIADFGAFIEIEPGIDGLVHVSQMSWERVDKPEDAVSIGQEIKVKVLDVDIENRRMSLSIKEATAKPVKEKKEPVEKEYQMPQDEPSGVTIGDIVGDIFNDMKK